MINSKEYWENRFATGDWDDFGGQEQTRFFYQLALDNLPQWLISDIQENDLSIVDIGCAEGAGTDLFKRKFSRSRVVGVDFSEAAINQAKERYRQCEFECNDINDIQERFDVIISSNVLEHLKDPFIQLDRLVELVDKYCIIILPFQEEKLHEEHFTRFDYDSFKMKIEDGYLIYHKEVEVSQVENSMWPGKQIILVYAKEKYLSPYKVKLSRIENGDFEIKSKLWCELENIKKVLVDKEQEVKQKDIEIQTNYEELKQKGIEIQTNYEEIVSKEKQIIEYQKQLNESKNEIQRQEESLQELKEHIDIIVNEKKEQLHKMEKQIQVIQDKDNEISRMHSQLDDINHQLEILQEQANSNRVLLSENSALKRELQAIYGSTLWRFAKRYYHFRDNTFPINVIFKSLKKARLKKINTEIHTIQCEEIINQNTKIDENIKNTKEDISINSVVKEEEVAERTNKYEIFIQDENYIKQDIIVLSVIDWDFRFQRPQHLAKGLANLGHRTFYFNANYHKQDSDIKEKMDNLYVVTLSNHFGERIYDINFNDYIDQMKQEMDRMLHGYNVRECTVIVEYPTWEPVARYLKEVFGFKIVFDYIDDYTGFEDTAHMGLVQSTKDLLKISDLTIATSTFLAEKANEHSNNIKIIRNGTEFEVFNKASNTKKSNKRPKVGYYGAIAEWFDISVVEHIAMNRPNIDVELIGHVSCDECNRLSKYKNVKFLGEKKYDELWKYLQEYDVCLIPFKSDIDLIKATNPVKFYEYLSAGKKIVATEIPELEPFRDKYVYLANDKERFLDYVDLCIKGEDQLANREECIEFAKTQDWSSRCIDMEKYIKDIHPLVSIIIITFNNLDITKKCINSIIEKTAYPNYEVIIVDNDSKDETPSYLEEIDKQYEQIKIILNGENSGFAGGNNIGIREAQGDYIILLNNDTLVTRGWINGLIKHLDKPGIGFIGPVTNSAGNESQINVEYSKTQDMDSFAMRYTTDHFNELYYDIRVLAMFCVAIKREVFNEIGFLDENYLVGMFEDDDYSMAIIRQGYKIACAEDVFIHHFGRASFSKIEDKRYKQIFEHNKKYYEEKWNTLWVPHKYRQE